MKRLLILLMMVSQPAWAEWVMLGDAPGGSDLFTYYWDPATVRKTPNGQRMWVMFSYEQQHFRSFGAYQSSKLLWEFDCGGERSRILQRTWHSGTMGAGSSINPAEDPSRWAVVSPGAVDEHALKAICRTPLKFVPRK
jgi:hypothetical protein